MSSVLYKLYFIAAESFACIAVIFLIFHVIEKNEEIEQRVNDSVNRKVDISSTYTDFESPEMYGGTDAGRNRLYLSGSAVLAEIITYDGTVTIQVNDMVINDYRTPTGEDIFEYMAKFGIPRDLADSISVTRRYEKTYSFNSDGKLVKVMYRLR